MTQIFSWLQGPVPVILDTNNQQNKVHGKTREKSNYNYLEVKYWQNAYSHIIFQFFKYNIIHQSAQKIHTLEISNEIIEAVKNWQFKYLETYKYLYMTVQCLIT